MTSPFLFRSIARGYVNQGKGLARFISLGLTLLAGPCFMNEQAYAEGAYAEMSSERYVPTVDTWQKRRLYAPTSTELRQEKRGSIMIYEGLTDTDVRYAVDHHFDRLEAMMFVGTILTDEQGNAKLDADTGDALVENDGCD